MQLTREKTKPDNDQLTYEDITKGMADFIIQNYGNLIKEKIHLFSQIKFITKRKNEILENFKETEITESPIDAMILGLFIGKVDSLIKTNHQSATVEGLTLLSLAVIFNDIKSIEKCLTMQRDFAYRETTLALAINNQNDPIRIIKLLLERKSFQELLNKFRFPVSNDSLLYYSIKNKKFDIAKYFILKGAEFHPDDSLELLAIPGLYEHPDLLIDVLILYRASRKICYFDPFTKYATNFVTLRLLIIHGARLAVPNIPAFLEHLHIKTTLQFAIYIQDFPLCEQILNTELRPDNIQREIYFAVFRSNVKILELLLELCDLSFLDQADILDKMLQHLPPEKQQNAVPLVLTDKHLNSNFSNEDFIKIFRKALDNCNYEFAVSMLKSAYFNKHHEQLTSSLITYFARIPEDQIEKFVIPIKEIVHLLAEKIQSIQEIESPTATLLYSKYTKKRGVEDLEEENKDQSLENSEKKLCR